MNCPICGRVLPMTSPNEKSFMPFCGERCQRVDFHRWWQGRYAIVDDVDSAQFPGGETASEMEEHY